MDYMIRPYRPWEERYAAEANCKVYSQEYRWGENFTYYASKIAYDFAAKEKNEREELWIAEADGKPVGCVMLVQAEEPYGPGTGQLRLFQVDKEYRRRGIGSALLDTFMQKAREAGYTSLMLWTAGPLTNAIRKYERLGFRIVETSENTDWSLDGDTVTEIKMEMAL